LKRDSQPVAVVRPVQLVPPSFSNTAYSGDEQAIVNAVRSGNVDWDSSLTLRAPDIAENGAVVPVEVSASRPFENGERLYLVVNDSFIGASLTPYDSRAQLFLSTRVKMPGTGQLKAVLVDASGRMRIAAKEVKVTIGADPGKSFGQPDFGPMKMRAANTGNVEIKSLFNSSQNPELYIKTISYLVDGIKVAEIGLTPGSSKNPYVAIKVSGSGGEAEMQVRASNGQTNSASARVN
jgi:sulfur-oxidizing protein SoxY